MPLPSTTNSAAERLNLIAAADANAAAIAFDGVVPRPSLERARHHIQMVLKLLGKSGGNQRR